MHLLEYYFRHYIAHETEPPAKQRDTLKVYCKFDFIPGFVMISQLKQLETFLPENTISVGEFIANKYLQCDCKFIDSNEDNVFNPDLTKRRVLSVKQELVIPPGIEAKPIETDGKDETQAIAPDDNSSGKAKNQRIQFIKM